MLIEIIHNQHLEMRELFTQHQEALLQGWLDDALNSLLRFDNILFTHIALEEKYLFPEFSGITRTSRWSTNLYVMEHEKVKQLYKNIANDLQWLSEQSFNDSDMRRNIIALLDKEKSFKGLLEHHEDREETAMLKELDKQLSKARLKELSSIIESVWEEVRTSLKRPEQEITSLMQ